MKKILFLLALVFAVILWIPQITNGGESNSNEYLQTKKNQSNKGSIDAPFQIGYCYLNGKGVKKDPVEAAKWFKIGAKRGNMQAAFELAGMYKRGEGVDQDLKEAIRWYKKIYESNNQMFASLAHLWVVILKPYELGLGDQWKPFFLSKGDQAAYIDTSSTVRLPDNKIRAWSMEETPNHEWFILWLYEIDCTQRMIILRDCKVGPSNMDLDKLTVQQKNKKHIDYHGVCSMFESGSPSYQYLDPTSDRDTAKYNMWCTGKNSLLGE
jgi:hypothetical protein